MSNYIFFTFPMLPVFLIFSNFMFSNVPIFLIFSHFLFPSFHISNFSNSPFPSHSHIQRVIFYPSISFSFHISFPLTFQLSQIPPNFHLNFPKRTSSIQLQLCSFHFTSQLHPLSSRYPLHCKTFFSNFSCFQNKFLEFQIC